MSIAQEANVTGRPQLRVAIDAVHAAADAIRTQFGHRQISAYKGQHDVQLSADLTAQQIIVDTLRSRYPVYGIVAEEGEFGRWPKDRFLWAVDPLDGTNNFGYGIAHCALAVTLFEEQSVLLAVIHDPITGRSFHKLRNMHDAPPADLDPTSLKRATLSLVTGYAEPGRRWGNEFTQWLSSRCKRVVNLWAPALDLALVASSTIDAMVCRDAALLDVCGGMFLVESAGGRIVDLNGAPLQVRRSMHDQPISFVAARNPALVTEILDEVWAFESPSSPIASARLPGGGSAYEVDAMEPPLWGREATSTIEIRPGSWRR